MSEPRVRTKEVTKSKEHKGWKVYIDGSKWPKKPVDYYTGMNEEQAIKKAVEEYLYEGLHGKARITDSCDKPVNVPQPIKVLQTDHLYFDSPDAGDPVCLCSRCSQSIPDGIGIIRIWPDQGEGEYRYHPACLGAVG